jgi:hypothetical protein
MRTTRSSELHMTISSGISLAPDPLPNSIGNFFDNTTDAVSFIQCYMLNLANIEGDQYGVGFPVDMPVMLGYFEGNEFLPVEQTHHDYDHLMNHVAVQMDSNDFQLYRTPVVLTLQGELEDNEEGEEGEEEEEEDEYDGEEYDDDEEEQLSLEELLAQEDEYDEYDEYEEDEGDEEDEEDEDRDVNEESSFMNESPIGKIDPKYETQPDVSIYRPKEGGDAAADLPPDAFVTAEDTKSLRRAHKRADRIMSYASDIKLIATFHYKKRNYHLVKLLDPIFVIGRRIHDIKGYYFSLLDEKESASVTPKLEQLLAQRNEDDKRRVAQGLPPSTAPAMSDGMDIDDGTSRGGRGGKSAPAATPRSKRSWRERKRSEREKGNNVG